MNDPQGTSAGGTVAIVSNEFFDPNLGRMGGFGWVAREAAQTILRRGSTAAEVLAPLFLTGEITAPACVNEARSGGVPLVYRSGPREEYAAGLRARDVRVLLSVDYRPDFDYPLRSLPHTPLIVWVQDPRPQSDVDKVNTLRIPGAEDRPPQGIAPIDCTPLARLVRAAQRDGRPVLFASPAPSTLMEKAAEAYGVRPDRLEFLPYSLAIDTGTIRKSDRPTVVFLGRLDPIKRPWVFMELARRFPGVEFLFMGQAHFKGAGAWDPSLAPDGVPENVRFVGHVEGAEKQRLLSAAWILVNPSIHEALPVSFVEALAYEIPIVSSQNPEDLAATFGHFAGRWDGTGLDGLASFATGLHRLLDDHDLRRRLGAEGRAWAFEHHTRARFLSAFDELTARAWRGESTPLRFDPATAPADAWDDEIDSALAEVMAALRPSETIILVNDGQWDVQRWERVATDGPGFARVLPLVERDGKFWGPPADGNAAVAELERLRAAGATAVVFAWPAFWWLTHYAKFGEHLRSRYRCLRENERVIVFDVR